MYSSLRAAACPPAQCMLTPPVLVENGVVMHKLTPDDKAKAHGIVNEGYPLALPAAYLWMDLFTSWEGRTQPFKTKWLTTEFTVLDQKPGEERSQNGVTYTVGCTVKVEGQGRRSNYYDVVPTPELLHAIARQIEAYQDDQITMSVMVRDDGTAIVTAESGKVMSFRTIAYIDGASVPAPMIIV